jgi:hypothetical protein
MGFSEARRAFDEERTVPERAPFAQGVGSSKGEVVEWGDDKAGKILTRTKFAAHDGLLDGWPFGAGSLPALDRKLQVSVRGDTLLVAVGGYGREVVFSKPFIVRPGGQLQDKMATVYRFRADRLDPLGKLLTSELPLQELTDL